MVRRCARFGLQVVPEGSEIVHAMTKPEQQPDDASRFIDLMTDGEAATYQTFDDQGSRGELARVMHGSFDELRPALRQLNARGAGVFWMVNYGDGGGRRAGNAWIRRLPKCRDPFDGQAP